MPDVNYDDLLDKYMYHVAQLNGGKTFIGVGYAMTGFSHAEIRALQRATQTILHDADLYAVMNPIRADPTGIEDT